MSVISKIIVFSEPILASLLVCNSQSFFLEHHSILSAGRLSHFSAGTYPYSHKTYHGGLVLSHSVATDTRRQTHHSASTTHHHHLVDVSHPDLEDSSVYKTPTSFLSLHSFLYRLSISFFCIGLCPTKPNLLYPFPPPSLALVAGLNRLIHGF